MQASSRNRADGGRAPSLPGPSSRLALACGRGALVVAAALLALACDRRAPAPLAAGTLRGHVRLKGTAPAPAALDRHSDPYCEATPRFDESVVVDARGGLRDVLVHLAGALPARAELAPGAPALLEQRACTYVPRLLAVAPGQALLVQNLDGTLHNVHLFRGTQTLLNRAQKIGSEPVGRELPGAPALLEVKCDVHPWMEARVYASDNPWFAVTGSDGAFEIRGAPSGRRTVQIWHAVYGLQSVEVEIPAGGVKELELELASTDANDAGPTAAAPAPAK